MRKHDSKWKTLIPLIVAMVVMTGVFILISYLSYRQNEIEDLENYARGLTKLIAGEIDCAVRRLIDECYQKAEKIILDNREVLERTAELLLEKEKIGSEEFEKVFQEVRSA